MFINEALELKKARDGGYAIGAFNTNNLEVTKAIALAAKNKEGIVLIQTTPSAIKYAGLTQIFNIIKNEIDSLNIKAAIHLDHAKDFETVRDAIDIGYKSVMIDGSRLSFSENVALTKKVVEYAHPKNVSVEGEIGVLGIDEGGIKSQNNSHFSDPEQTSQFVKLTGVDSIAVSIGNEHGAPKGEKIDLLLLKQIAQIINIPLVLHGSSGLSDSDIHEAIKLGITKINVDTLIRRSFIHGIKNYHEETSDYRDIMTNGMNGVYKVVAEKIDQFKNKKEYEKV